MITIEDTEGGLVLASNKSDKDGSVKRSLVLHGQTSEEADNDSCNQHFNMSNIEEVKVEEFDDSRGKSGIEMFFMKKFDRFLGTPSKKLTRYENDWKMVNEFIEEL